MAELIVETVPPIASPGNKQLLPTLTVKQLSTVPSDIHLLDYNSLPDPRKVWPGAPNSQQEGLGRLAILTPDVVASAAACCIRSGRRVSLNWDLTKLDVANFGRNALKHDIIPLLGGIAYDDVYTFNPQQSSQWDGLRHFSAPFPTEEDSNRRLFYGGVTAAEIEDRENKRIGLQYWAKEGICGRGILLDYVEYAERHGIEYSTFSNHAISLSVLLDIAKEQSTYFRRGDILFVRIGVTTEWDTKMSDEDKLAYAHSSSPQHAGLEGTEEMLRWIWNTGFSAVAGDAISFEVYPPQKSYRRDNGESKVPGLFMHEILLAGWGMPIGELFDLAALAQICKESQRWEFFVSAAPFNMPGGISSPPNCIAIF